MKVNLTGDSHCGTGCQSGCTTTGSATTTQAASVKATPTSAPRADGHCGVAFEWATCDPAGEFGGCCSEYGYVS